MQMKTNRSGTSRLETAQVTRDFMVAPLEMRMQMHMFGAMWAPHKRVTLMTMIPYKRIAMDHINRMGRTFTTWSNGLGDVSLTPLITVWSSGNHRLQFNPGISAPTGSIDKRGGTLMGPDQKLPYPMQLGSGTPDIRAALSYSGASEWWHWGAQPGATVRLGRNKHDYRLGNRFKGTAWLGRKLDEVLGASLRATWEEWGDIKGHDSELTRTMVPTAEAGLRAGERLDMSIGVSLEGTEKILKDHRFAFEAGFPVYQYLDGPQLETDWTLTIGYQYPF